MADKNNSTIIDFVSGTRVKATPEVIEAVQPLSRKLVKEYGYSKGQIQTRPQFRVRERPSGKDKYPVDIAVFLNNDKKEDDLYIVAECKRKTRKDGEKQLRTYLRLSAAQIGVWYNGRDHLYLQKEIDKAGRVRYREIFALPKKGERIEDVGKYKRKDLKEASNLKLIFKDLRNHLAGNLTGITRDEALATEIINLLFCKIYDELYTGENDVVRFRAGINENIHHVSQRVNELFSDVKDEYDDVFDKSTKIMLDLTSLAYIVGELQIFEITSARRDVIGDAFEVFIGPAIRGPEGQFFTPRNVVKMAVEMLDPAVGEFIIDPACGSGGFLIAALEHIWKKLECESRGKGWTDKFLQKRMQHSATKYFRGIDKDSFLAKLTKAYMAIIGDGRGGVFCENSLSPQKDWKHVARDQINFAGFDILLTNPPFGSKIPVSGVNTLEQFHLAYKWKKDKDGSWLNTGQLEDERPPQILFIERCLDLLKDKGRMAIVLPDGILGNVNDGYIRQFLLDRARLIAIIDLPKETFQLPNSRGTSTKTSVVFLQKIKDPSTLGNYDVFIASVEKCGHDRRGKDIPEDDIPEVIDKFRQFRNNYAPF